MSKEQASEILNQVSAVYTGCKSYRDTGTCTSVKIASPHRTERHSGVIEFDTVFSRPDLFRFEYRDRAPGPCSEWQRSVLWQLSQKIRFWWTHGDAVERFDDLQIALGGLAAVSNGTATFVPCLLNPVASPFVTHSHYENAKYMGTERHNGQQCYKLEVNDTNEHELLWIDRETHLVVKIETKRVIDIEDSIKSLQQYVEDDYNEIEVEVLEQLESMHLDSRRWRTEQTTLYQPEINCKIKRDVFEFEPPG